MGEMFAWYIDNSKYFTEDFSKMIINYSVEAKRENVSIKDVVKKYSPEKGNTSANPTAARDFGIINNDSLLSDGAIMFNSGFYKYSDFVLDQISKRNVAKSKDIPLKPLVIIAKVFEKMWSLCIEPKEILLTTDECYKYLSIIDSYDEITDSKVLEIINNRTYKEDSNIPNRALPGINIGVYLAELFTALSDSKLFELGLQKTILKPVCMYSECIKYISKYGENISLAPTVRDRDNEALYNYLCNIDTGIKEIIPNIEFKIVPEKNQIKNLYSYLFGIDRFSFEWNKYFDDDCFGIYRIFFPIERIVFAKIYTRYKQVAEYLCDYSNQSAKYIERIIGGKLMIEEPFASGHTHITELNSGNHMNYITDIKEGIPRNLIIFGAPGTGKSFELNEKRKELLGVENADNFERVTFHPEYSYANFVGSYKPTMVSKEFSKSDDVDEIIKVLTDKNKTSQEKYDFLYPVFKEKELTSLPILLGLFSDEIFETRVQDGTDVDGDNNVERNQGRELRSYVNLISINESTEDISYKYIPGPFMRILVEALKSAMTDNPKPYLLVIEEINRANVSAVFGDVFQLLDRNGKNTSEYEISTSNDMRSYLAKELNVDESKVEKIRIPDNLFIWATMNSADQGVFPMDTAFKRRWEFRYLGIDDAEENMPSSIKERKYKLGDKGCARLVTWNEIRTAINEELSSSEYNINEDKLLGPYFISKSVLEGSDQDFMNAFKNKVLMYLFEDVIKQKRKTFFAKCQQEKKGIRYSNICNLFDNKGVFIFPESISSLFTQKPDEEVVSE